MCQRTGTSAYIVFCGRHTIHQPLAISHQPSAPSASSEHCSGICSTLPAQACPAPPQSKRRRFSLFRKPLVLVPRPSPALPQSVGCGILSKLLLSSCIKTPTTSSCPFSNFSGLDCQRPLSASVPSFRELSPICAAPAGHPDPSTLNIGQSTQGPSRRSAQRQDAESRSLPVLRRPSRIGAESQCTAAPRIIARGVHSLSLLPPASPPHRSSESPVHDGRLTRRPALLVAASNTRRPYQPINPACRGSCRSHMSRGSWLGAPYLLTIRRLAPPSSLTPPPSLLHPQARSSWTLPR